MIFYTSIFYYFTARSFFLSLQFERTNGSISLHNFAINDSGVYKCTASSSYGIDQDVMHINVTGK